MLYSEQQIASNSFTVKNHKIKRHLVFIILIILNFIIEPLSFAQSDLPVATNFEEAYKNGTRDSSGVPGKNYWQNSANYLIEVKFDPTTMKVQGKVEIEYCNNSPDTLNQVLFKLFPNLYQAGGIRKMPVSPKDLIQGVEIDVIKINGQLLDSDEYKIRGTNMTAKGLSILPGQKTHFEISYNFVLNRSSFIRTGQVDPGAFVIAYFFPRIAVYDDIEGWDNYPYVGREEFYNDYGNFNVAITVPDDYQVWATGSLTNPESVYNSKFVQLIKEASINDGVTAIITEADIKNGNITKKNGWNTWKFAAENVIDFAFATSNHYVWNASSVMVDTITKRRTRVDAVFNPDHEAYLPVVDYARKSVGLISNQFPAIPFPYPHMTIFEGLDAMEYPMLVNNLPFEKSAAIVFTMHEVFHSIFPFYVGTNETKYSFMDEGWATLAEFMLYPFFDSNIPLEYDISDVNNTASSDQDVPIMTLTPQLYGKARYANKDLKPALGLLYVKEMLGDTLFNQALKFYINNWKGKHPTPYDFFSSFNTGAGVDLNWFWKNWFFDKTIPDLAIGKVTHHQSNYKVVIDNIGNAVVPIHLNISYADGSREVIHRDISCWKKGNASITLEFTSQKLLKQLVLGADYDVDINKENNVINY